MRRRRLAAGVGVLALLAIAGGVVAAGAQDQPAQDATPAPDPVGEAIRQATPDPAPAPVVIPPPEPAPEPDAVADETVEVAQTATVPAPVAAAPAEPSRRQRRPTVVIEAVDKITAESMRFAVEVGGRPVRFNRSLIFTARACEISAPDERVEDAVAYLDVAVQPRPGAGQDGPRQIFRGWMFASSPGVNGLQHPIYDAWVVGCRA